MVLPSSPRSVFVVDSTYQLLNAIEAAHALNLPPGHLVICKAEGPARESFRPMIALREWAGVQFLSPYLNTDRSNFRFLGSRAGAFVGAAHARYLHFRRLRRVARAIAKLTNVDNLFLGHYWPGPKDFMRHFANALRHRTLYLLDDGTDIIDINQRRRALAEAAVPAAQNRDSPREKINSRLREKYWQWDTREAESVTFFTAYDLQVRPGDHLITNHYGYLRSRAAAAARTDEIFFLGQCLVDDGYMQEERYLEYLGAVRAHYATARVRYIAHPRESAQMLERVREITGFEVTRFAFPVEYQLIVQGPVPATLASFFCSALESCFHILGETIEITGFYLQPEHLLKLQDVVAETYAYFERRVSPHFRIVRLPPARIGGSGAPRTEG